MAHSSHRSAAAARVGATGHPPDMDGWQHSTLDYDPERDGSEEEWARAVAADGWRTWHPTGVWITVGSRRVRRWAMQRPCLRPWTSHDHAGLCGP